MAEDKDRSRLGRLNLRIDKSLKRDAHAYARRRNTTLTEIVETHLRRLLKEESEAEARAEVEQI